MMVYLNERIHVLLRQEQDHYKTENYLDPDFQQMLANNSDLSLFDDSIASDNASSSSSTITEVWRTKICEWSYQVIDHFDFSREVVGVAIHYLDRYLATQTVNRKLFQLAAMTCLSLAIKLYEPAGRLSMPSMIELSRGYFTVDQMVAMETTILRALSWHVHPPNAYCFVRHMMYLLPSTISMNHRLDIQELARFLTELSVIDYFFVTHRPSDVSMAAVLNAIEDVSSDEIVTDEHIYELKQTLGLDANSDNVFKCRERLRLMYAKGEYARAGVNSGWKRDDATSPVCVTYGCKP